MQYQKSELALEYYVTAVALVSAATTALKGENTHYDCVLKDLVEWHSRSEVYIIIHCKFKTSFMKFKTTHTYTSVLLTIPHRSPGFSSPPTSHERSLLIGQNKSYDGNDSDLRCIDLGACKWQKSQLVSPRPLHRCSLRLLLHTLTVK